MTNVRGHLRQDNRSVDGASSHSPFPIPHSAFAAKRRASVLVLVMTVLSILFVAGITLLTTMNFEADVIQSVEIRDRREVGMDAILDNVSTVLRDGLISSLEGAFSAAFDPTSPSRVTFIELPGHRGLISPVEPMGVDANGDGQPEYVAQPWVTDAEWVVTGNPNALVNVTALITQLQGLDSRLTSGTPLALLLLNVLGPGNYPPELENNPDYAIVDSDGDGIVDSFQIDAAKLGFTESQLRELAVQLNASGNPRGRVFLSLRVVPHGGMVSLNASHPNIVANILGLMDPATGKPVLQTLYEGSDGDPLSVDARHRPALWWKDPLNSAYAAYSPLQEEFLLRRRGILPPRTITPSLLHGNPLLSLQALSAGTASGDADLGRWLYPPDDVNASTFESVYENAHRYWPFAPDELYNARDPDPKPLWSVRMEPFTSQQAMPMDPNGMPIPEYDRRHLLTTMSYDDLLSRGGRVESVRRDAGCNIVLDTSTPPKPLLSEMDLRQAMIQANRCTYDAASATCPQLPFEYVNYPVDPYDGGACNCLNEPECKLDPRNGRLQLSLPWLDEQFRRAYDPNITLPAAREQVADALRRVIHDAYFSLVNNAMGAYWRETDCSPRGTNGQCGPQEFCDNNPATGDFLCHDSLTQLSRREHLLFRTAASLTANMIDYADLECASGANRGLSCQTDADCGGAPGSGACADLAIPTRIKMRMFDFTFNTCYGGPDDGVTCLSQNDCAAPGRCQAAAGKDLGGPGLSTLPTQYVYGLERQPYITEVATHFDPAVSPSIVGRAIELFNPYSVPIPGGDGDGDGEIDYLLFEINPSTGLSSTPVLVQNPIPNNTFFTYATNAAVFPPTGNYQDLPLTDLTFDTGSTILLVRRVRFPGDTLTTNIVIDQFTIAGGFVGTPVTPPAGPTTYSLERVASQSRPWACTVPRTSDGSAANSHSLGTWNAYSDTAIRPVEVQFANTGGFSRVHPLDVDDPASGRNDPSNDQYGRAFPTTGSMLLLMRHANRSLADYDPAKSTELAFTTWLDQAEWRERDPVTTFSKPIIVEEYKQIDNGRMPIFDTVTWIEKPATPATGLRRFAHHQDTAGGACCYGAGQCIETQQGHCNTLGGSFSIGASCLGDNNLNGTDDYCDAPTGDIPVGGAARLPWGQLVFDYFTALPLSNKGPYFMDELANLPPGATVDEVIPIRAPAQPQVDMGGLRVHGRINLNAAPWKALEGVPLMPMQRMPAAYRAKLRWGAGIVNPGAVDVLNPDPAANPPDFFAFDNEAASVFPPMAQAITAYRELREICGIDFEAPLGDCESTGNFGDTQIGHASQSAAAPFRRGPGFLTVGEIANVRSAGAHLYTNTSASGDRRFAYHRADFGELAQNSTGAYIDPNPDYVEAVGWLVALGDWLTTRSQVFTVFGTLRGEYDPELVAALPPNPTVASWRPIAMDVDSRAVRFQETIDRLPALLGEPKLQRVGQRVTKPYLDARDD